MNTKKQSWISAKEFSYKFDVTEGHIYVAKSDKLAPSYVFSKNKSLLYIDEAYFIRREEYNHRIKMELQDFYFYLRNNYRMSHIIKLMGQYFPSNVSLYSLRDYLYYSLFSTVETKILNTKMNKLQWRFYRFYRWYKREVNVDYD